MTSESKLEAPREETRKKMHPVKRDEFTKLVNRAIHTSSKKAPAKAARSENPSSGKK